MILKNTRELQTKRTIVMRKGMIVHVASRSPDSRTFGGTSPSERRWYLIEKTTTRVPIRSEKKAERRTRKV